MSAPVQEVESLFLYGVARPSLYMQSGKRWAVRIRSFLASSIPSEAGTLPPVLPLTVEWLHPARRVNGGIGARRLSHRYPSTRRVSSSPTLRSRSLSPRAAA